jgi:hypothetical protein
LNKSVQASVVCACIKGGFLNIAELNNKLVFIFRKMELSPTSSNGRSNTRTVGVTPITNRLSQYKMTTPPWKDAFRAVRYFDYIPINSFIFSAARNECVTGVNIF